MDAGIRGAGERATHDAAIGARMLGNAFGARFVLVLAAALVLVLAACLAAFAWPADRPARGFPPS